MLRAMKVGAAGLVIAAFAGVLGTAGAQDPRIPIRLDAPSKAAILALVDSARAQGIPVEPLMEKVYEGIARGADGRWHARVTVGRRLDGERDRRHLSRATRRDIASYSDVMVRCAPADGRSRAAGSRRRSARHAAAPSTPARW